MRRGILVIDDDRSLRKTLSDILRLKGYEPLAAGTGREALGIAEGKAPAVALIDLRLGDMEGLAVLERLKEQNPAIACIVLTGHASQSSAIEAINLGAYSYLQKPYDVDQLLLTVRRAIEKQEADTALRQSQALLHATGRMAKIGGWELDPQTRVFVWTDEVYRIYGVDPGFEPTESAILARYSPEARAPLRRALEAARTSGASFELELPLTAPQNDVRWVHIMGRAESDGSTISKVSGTIQDITERKHSEEALRTSNRRLEEALAQLRETQEQVISQERLAAVGQLAAGLAHEYNNLMATIVLYADMMLRTSALGPADRERTTAIYQEGRRAADLTQQILDFSRRAILRKESVQLGAFLADLEQRLRQSLPERIGITVDASPEPVGLYVDPERLRQAMVNMALNARDAMPQGGDLRITGRQITVTPDAPRPVEGLEPGQWVVLSMADSGTGIHPEVLPHIFEPFFTTRSPLGSGLGLSQVYGIVRQHDGQIGVQSKVGEGSTFEIYLPAVALPSPPTAEGGGDGVSRRTQRTAITLVIEEHNLVREALRIALENLNHRAWATPTLADALAKRDRSMEDGDACQVKLILSDVTNGDLSGIALVHELNARFPGARIILIGDRVPDRDVRPLIEEGTVRWLAKPIDLVKLVEALADIAFER